MKHFIFLILSIFFLGTSAQTIPAVPQIKPVWITNATLHLGNGSVIEHGMIGFDHGKISYVGTGSEIRIDRNSCDIIDGTGKHVYPGLIALDTYLGLNEIESIQATIDHQETGSSNPNVRTLIAYNADSKVVPTIKTIGVLLAQITPTGGMLSGSSSVVQLDAWNWEDAAYFSDDALHINWPNMDPIQAWWAGSIEDQQKNTMQTLDELDRFFSEAKAYQNAEKKVYNVRFASMKRLFEGNQQLFIHVSQAKGIIASVLFAEKYGLKPIIVGGEDALLIADFLKKHRVPIVVKVMHRLPQRDDDSVDDPYTFPARLRQAGISFAIAGKSGWEGRNLPFEAGTAGAWGLGKEDALKSITLSAAEILGIDKKTGSLEIGKDANVLLTSGDILNMSSSNLERAFIQGRNVSLETTQTQLYKKFKAKK